MILDGGMGQALLARSSRELSNLWSADVMFHEPHLVQELHSEFIDAGAQVITLNTYTATPDRLAANNASHMLEAMHQKALDAAQQARDNSDPSVKIAGCLPPLLASYRPDVAPAFADSVKSYEALVALQANGCDLFICETMSSITEASAACTAAKNSGLPVWLALSVNDQKPHQLRSGEDLTEALEQIEALSPDAILLNCSRPEAISDALPKLKNMHTPFGAYANGFTSVDTLYPGETVEHLQTRKDLGPSEYLAFAQQWADMGATIIGGCCEVGPAHIKAIAEEFKN